MRDDDSRVGSRLRCDISFVTQKQNEATWPSATAEDGGQFSSATLERVQVEDGDYRNVLLLVDGFIWPNGILGPRGGRMLHVLA